jgi:hypothetical protein
VGGVATTAEAGGVTWTVIGVPAAVEEIRSGLSDR